MAGLVSQCRCKSARCSLLSTHPGNPSKRRTPHRHGIRNCRVKLLCSASTMLEAHRNCAVCMTIRCQMGRHNMPDLCLRSVTDQYLHMHQVHSGEHSGTKGTCRLLSCLARDPVKAFCVVCLALPICHQSALRKTNLLVGIIHHQSTGASDRALFLPRSPTSRPH